MCALRQVFSWLHVWSVCTRKNWCSRLVCAHAAPVALFSMRPLESMFSHHHQGAFVCVCKHCCPQMLKSLYVQGSMLKRGGGVILLMTLMCVCVD